MHSLNDLVQAELEDNLDTETEDWQNNTKDELLVEARFAVKAALESTDEGDIRSSCVAAITALLKTLTVYGRL